MKKLLTEMTYSVGRVFGGIPASSQRGFACALLMGVAWVGLGISLCSYVAAAGPGGGSGGKPGGGGGERGGPGGGRGGFSGGDRTGGGGSRSLSGGVQGGGNQGGRGTRVDAKDGSSRNGSSGFQHNGQLYNHQPGKGGSANAAGPGNRGPSFGSPGRAGGNHDHSNGNNGPDHARSNNDHGRSNNDHGQAGGNHDRSGDNHGHLDASRGRPGGDHGWPGNGHGPGNGPDRHNAGPWRPGGDPWHHSGGPGFHHPPYDWYRGRWDDHWHHPWYVGPAAWFSVGFVAGAVVCEAPWHWGYWHYYNPYYTEVILVDGTPIDYSRPIVVAAPSPGATSSSSTVAENQATQLMNAARNAFTRGDYAGAMTQVNQAIVKKPNDTALHEFRALVLFAKGDYKESAATIYAVLSMGPGWDWATMSNFYSNVDTYTAQLRTLEEYRNAHLESPEIRFLLAYHYLSCGYPEASQNEFKEVVRINPKDQLAKQLLAGVTNDQQQDAPEPAAAPELVPAGPMDATSLVGSWRFDRAEDESFDLSLTGDSTYTWKYVNAGKTQEFAGAYTVADNLLILKRDGNPVMIGKVTLLDGNRFNFKLAGDNPADPGLTFTKK